MADDDKELDQASEPAQEAVKPPDLEELRRQAEKIRGLRLVELHSTAYPAWKKWLYMLILLGVHSGSVVLLASSSMRQGIIVRAGQVWSRLHDTSETSQVFELPPPPPKAVEPKDVYPDAPFVIRTQPNAETAEPGAEESGDSTETPQAPLPPTKNADTEKAYQLLLQKSEVVKKLADNALSGYKFQDWKPVKADPPQYYLNIVAVRESDGQQMQFIWSINTDDGTTRALSQSARDLESAKP